MLEIGVDTKLSPAVKPTRKSSAAAKAKASQQQALHILYVGRFIHFKGMDSGLRAVANLRARGIPARLTMIGQGSDKRRWQALVARLRLEHCVTWIPWMKQQDLLEAYRTFDVLLFPSLHDSSGNVVLEAMAGGLPVVCLALGGPAQLVNNNCGRVVPVENRSAQEIIEALADALAEFAIDPQLVAQLRAGGQQRGLGFAWNQVVAQVWGKYGTGCKAVTDSTLEENTYVSA